MASPATQARLETLKFSRFDLFVCIDRQRGLYQLRDALLWEVGRSGSGWWVLIPPGTAFDLSVPRGLGWLVSRHNRRWLPAAALHDHLLRKSFDRAFAAGEFYRALRARAPDDWRIWWAWLFVSLWTMR